MAQDKLPMKNTSPQHPAKAHGAPPSQKPSNVNPKGGR